MAQKRCFWMLLGAAHLVIVLFGACDWLPERNRGPAVQPLRWYATMSAADSGFAFFAPQVGSTHRVRFLLYDEQGQTRWDTFDQSHNSEAWLRLTGSVDSAFMAARAQEEPEWRQRLVKSWAATMLRRHPQTVKLEVVVEAYWVPTMAEYRAGARPAWQVVYQAQVQRHAKVDWERME